jgi:hypothetical protein
MVDAMTSGLHHIGARQEASKIWQKRKQFQFKPGAYTQFLVFMQNKIKHLSPTHEKASTFNLLECKPFLFVLCCIKGADGKEDNCICVYNRWIFNSNFENALSLTRAALDLCCSSSEEGTIFEKSTQVAKFPHIYKFKKR